MSEGASLKRPTRHVLEKLTVIVPCFNEEAVVKLFHHRLTSVLVSAELPAFEIIYVDDGSADSTAGILRSMAAGDQHMRVIRLSRNFGHQNALLAGLLHGRGNVVITIDSDLQDPPELIPTLLKEWERGSKVVSAQRKTREGETWFKLQSAALYYRLLTAISSVPITEDCGDYRLLDAEVVLEICSAAEADPYIRGLVGWLGFKETVVRYDRQRRAAGRTKYSLVKMIALARQGVLSTSTIGPKIPLVVSLVSTIGLVISLVSRSETKSVFWGGLLADSFLLAVMGQYLDSISRNSGKKPAFVVDEIFSTFDRSVSTETPESSHNHRSLGVSA